MPYRIDVAASARKDLKKLPRDIQERATATITALADEPRPPGAKKLKLPGNRYSVRIGRDYRIVYRIEDTILVVTVLRARHRKDVCRDL